MTRLLAILLFIFLAAPVYAQEEAEEEKSYFLSFVENQLSAPNRRISLSGINGVLSSEVSVGTITVADRDGVWLRINNAKLVWSRAALLLGRLNINDLQAESIDLIRPPLPDPSLPTPESSGFSVPELPLSVRLDALDINKMHFGKDVFGLESTIGLTGRLTLASGVLDTDLSIKRLDGPGGEFLLKAAFSNQDKKLSVDVNASEPANGMIANLMKIDGRPAVDLTVKGEGSLDDVAINLTLDTDKTRTLTGVLTLKGQAEGRSFDADFSGPIQVLVPQEFRDFFGSETSLVANGIVKDAGGMRLDEMVLKNAALKLSTSAESSTDGFIDRLRIDAAIAGKDGQPVILPVSGGETTIRDARVQIAFGDRPDNDWLGHIEVNGLSTGRVSSENIAFQMGGIAENLNNPAERRITFNVTGGINNINADTVELAQALGEKVTLLISGGWKASQPVDLQQAKIAGNGLDLELNGKLSDFVFTGDVAAHIADLSPYGAIAGRELAGQVALEAKGRIEPLTGAFMLDLDGSATSIGTGSAEIDALMAGKTTLSGAIGRGSEGLSARAFLLENPQSKITANGLFGSSKADFDFALILNDLAMISKDISGKLQFSGSAKGDDSLIAISAKADMAQGRIAEHKLSGAEFDINAMLNARSKISSVLSGQLSGAALLNGEKVDVATLFTFADGDKHIENLQLKAGAATATGNIIQNNNGLITGAINIAAHDVSTVGTLLLAQASGALNGDIKLNALDGRQNANINLKADDLKFNDAQIASADIALTAQDLFGVPVVNGSAHAQQLKFGTTEIDSIDAKADAQGQKTNFDISTKLRIGTLAEVSGSLEPQNDGYLLTLNKADIQQDQLKAHLVSPATIGVNGANLALSDMVIDAGGGRINIKGMIADQLDLSLAITDLPLAIANAIDPKLGIGGTLQGSAKIIGTRDQPDINFDLRALGVTASQLKEQSIAPLDITATGRSTQDSLNVDARLAGGGGIDATVKGAVPLGSGELALDVNLAQLPLALLNGAIKDQNFGGNITGNARIGGKLDNPNARFTLNGSGLANTQLRDNGLSPLSLHSEGQYANQVLNLSSVKIDGPKGLNVTASGKVPLSGNGLDVNITGNAPLELANRILAERGAQASGSLSLTASVSGNFQNPQLRGMVSTNGAQFIDAETNIRLNNINIMASLDGDKVNLRQVQASLASGGSISASGSISTNAAADFPANISIKFDQARYADGTLVVATINGGLSIEGALLRDPLISGRIEIERAEISVPESMGGSASTIDVHHINTPLNVARTLARAKVETRKEGGVPVPSNRPSVPRLDVVISAPNQIFVRGRGLDAEMGGRLRIQGNLNNIQPVGGFSLIRGRLSILGQRIIFDEGQVTLIGDLNPQLNFVARTEGNDITVLVTVRGTPDNLDVNFSSQPELPQDEVLARLLFNRSMSELSPFQIAQLAAAAAELAGGSNNSLVGSFRKGMGLDDLDIITDEHGNAAVRAGSYIRDNIYLGVEAGSGGDTKGTINLDITRNLKAKASMGSDGNSNAGIYYEKDY